MAEHSYSRTHKLNGEVLQFDLAERSAGILEAARGEPSGRASEALAKEGGLRLVLMGFTSGALMHEHHADGAVLVQVLNGLVSLKLDAESLDLCRDEAVVMRAGVVHSVVARTDSVLLLTVTQP